MSGEMDRHVPRISRRRALGSLSALAAAGLAACSAPRAPSGAGSSASAPAGGATASAGGTAPAAGTASAVLRTPVTWKHAVASYKFDTAFQLMGLEKGYFRELGIELEPVAVTSGDNMLRGVLVGEFDSGDFGPSIAFPAIAMGGGVKLIGTNNPRVPHVLFGKREINDLRDLYGRLVGTAAPGAFLHALITATMVKEGLEPDRVQWVNVGASPDVFRAVVSGKIDAGVSSIEYEPEIPAGADVKVVLPFGPRLPDYVKQAVVVSDKSLRERRDAVVAFAIAYTRGHRWAVAHKDDTVALAAKLADGKPDVMALAYDRYVDNKLLDLNFYLAPSAIELTQQIGVQQGLQDQILPLERVATWEIQQEVVKALGEQSY